MERGAGPHVVIVGAGVVGAAIARSLAIDGAKVTVIEAARPAAGATSKSFSWINADFAQTPAYWRLRHAALAEWRGLPAAAQAGVQWCGSIAWEETGPPLDARLATMRANGYEAGIIHGEEIARLEPRLAAPPERAIRCRIDGAVDPVAATTAFLDQATALGAVRLIGCEVTGFQTSGGKIAGVKTGFGPITADAVVIAAGLAGVRLAAKAGVALALGARPGLIVHTAPLAPVITHILLSPEIHFRQGADGRIVAGEIFSGGGPAIEERPRDLAAAIIDRLRRRLPGVEGVTPEAVMLGRRPTPADGMPLVGAPGAAPGLYIAAMHSGITLAPVIGRLVAAELLAGERDDLLAPFHPDRPAPVSG